MKVRGKQRHPKEFTYNSPICIPFTTTALAATILNSTVQSRIVLGTDCKVFRVTAVLNGTAAGTCSINVVVGEGAEGATPTDDTSDFYNSVGGQIGSWTYNTTSGIKLFSSDQAITMTTGTPMLFIPTVPDAIFQQGTELTLRFATNGSATASESVSTFLWILPIDTHPTIPMAASTVGGASHPWNWTTDV